MDKERFQVHMSQSREMREKKEGDAELLSKLEMQLRQFQRSGGERRPSVSDQL
jgi:hypothetical protein